MPNFNSDELSSFKNSLYSHMKILRENFNVISLEVLPDKASPLYLVSNSGEPVSLFLPLDREIGLPSLLNGSWDVQKINFIKIATEGLKNLCLVDVGANIGLIARECLSFVDNIKTVFAYEPHPDNFNLLRKNLGGIQRVNLNLNNFGLGKESSTSQFFLDPANVGNYSLNVNAMPSEYSTTEIMIVSAK